MSEGYETASETEVVDDDESVSIDILKNKDLNDVITYQLEQVTLESKNDQLVQNSVNEEVGSFFN